MEKLSAISGQANVHASPTRMTIPPAPFFKEGVLKSPFEKGGFRGI
jgi:hypothetical protein